MKDDPEELQYFEMIEYWYLNGIEPNAMKLEAERRMLLIILGLLEKEQPVEDLRLNDVLI